MRFQIMDHTGHKSLEFSELEKAESDNLFMELIKEGRTAATRKDGASDYTVIRSPVDVQDDTLFMTQRQAG